MRSINRSWKIVSVFALGVVLSVGYGSPTLAFTLVERLLLPAVQLVAGQAAAIKVTNFSTSSVMIVIRTYNDDGGIIAHEGRTIGAGMTFTDTVQATAKSPLSFHVVIELDTPNALVSDVLTISKQTGEVIAIAPAFVFANQ